MFNLLNRYGDKKMKLKDKQFRFTNAIGFLIRFAFENKYFLTFGDAYRDKRCNYGHPQSAHKNRLAVDFNLFIDGEYIQDSDNIAWRVLHNEWERLGGAPMIKKDANHFSFEHNGVI